MAYTATVATTVERHSQRNHYTITVTEAEAQGGGSPSEYSVAGLPRRCTIERFTSVLTAGTGTTVQPRIGRSTGFVNDSIDQIDRADSAAAYNVITGAVQLDLPDGTLYARSEPDDATADHSVSTVICITEGWV